MLSQILTRWRNDQKRTALVFNSSSYSYSEIFSISSILANNLYKIGVRKNSKIALFMDNRPELVWLYFAIFKLGAIVVPVNYRYKSLELSYILENCQADMLITEEIKNIYVEESISKTKKNLNVFSVSHHENQKWDNFNVLLDSKTQTHPEQIIKEDDLAVLLYTSGSTSKPKGVMHSHHSVLSAAYNLTQTIQQNETCINGTTLPICHVAGLIGQVISTILVGGKIVLFPKFDAPTLVEGIEKHKITHLQMVPVNLVELIDCINIMNFHLESLRSVMVGGDKVPENLKEKFFELSHCHITEVIGMTESFSYCINLSHDKRKLGSAGKPAAGVTIELVDDQDKPVKNQEVGELKILSQGNMIGYWKNPKDTAKTLRNSWVYSGDLAYLDQDNYIWFVGRKKQLIIRGGSNISPQEVENVLNQHPSIKEVCIIGFPNPKFKQIVCACVVLNPKMSLSLEEVKQFCKKQLSDYKIPEKLLILNKLPHNTTGKLDRNKISDIALTM